MFLQNECLVLLSLVHYLNPSPMTEGLITRTVKANIFCPFVFLTYLKLRVWTSSYGMHLTHFLTVKRFKKKKTFTKEIKACPAALSTASSWFFAHDPWNLWPLASVITACTYKKFKCFECNMLEFYRLTDWLFAFLKFKFENYWIVGLNEGLPFYCHHSDSHGVVRAFPLPGNTATDFPKSFSCSAVGCDADVVLACVVSVEFLAAVVAAVVPLGRVLARTLVSQIFSNHR